MPSHCCVVGCTQRGYTTKDGEKVSFFNFPKDPTRRKQWIHAIRRDEGKEFQITEKTKVCSLHFKPSALKKTLTGRVHPLNTSIPSLFKWSISPKKRKAPKERLLLNPSSSKKQKLLDKTEVFSTEDNESITGESDAVINPEDEQSKRLDKDYIKELEDKLALLEREVQNYKRRSEELFNENQRLEAEVESLQVNNLELKSRTFHANRFNRDQDFAFYTGMPNINVYNAMFEYLDPGLECENICRKEKANEEVPENFYDEDNEQDDSNKRGRKSKITPNDQFFIVLCRLRRGFAEQHLAHLYGVAQSTISRILTTWINFMYLKFAPICIWPSRQTIDETMPAIFKEKYPHTRVIIDCTEVRCEMPSSLLLNSELFSSYKNHLTLKALVGIAPNGALTYISQLYTGSISDREIVTRSGFLSQQFDDGDQVMADKGFQIDDLLPLGVKNNIPPFLGGDSQMSAEDVIKTRQIASVRIHVERAINKIKNFHIWDRVIPLSMFGVVNQMWTVCAFLCNTHDPLISE